MLGNFSTQAVHTSTVEVNRVGKTKPRDLLMPQSCFCESGKHLQRSVEYLFCHRPTQPPLEFVLILVLVAASSVASSPTPPFPISTLITLSLNYSTPPSDVSLSSPPSSTPAHSTSLSYPTTEPTVSVPSLNFSLPSTSPPFVSPLPTPGLPVDDTHSPVTLPTLSLSLPSAPPLPAAPLRSPDDTPADPALDLSPSPSPPVSQSPPSGYSSPLISKCCLPDEVLSFDPEMETFACTPLSDAGRVETGPINANLPEESVTEERVDDLLRRGFPEWLDVRMMVEDAAGNDVAILDFLEANEQARVVYGAHPNCSDPQMVWAVQRDRFRLLGDGGLRLRLGAWGGAGELRLPPEDFCADRVLPPPGTSSPPRVALLACPCGHTLCVRKCCKGKKVLHVTVGRHVSLECSTPPTAGVTAAGSAPWKPAFYDDNLQPLSEPPTYHLLHHSYPDCPAGYAQILLNSEPGSALRMWVFRNGSALMENFGHGVPLNGSRWCGDASVPATDSLLPGDGWGGSELSAYAHNALLCLPTLATEEPNARPTASAAAYGVMFSIGALFLLLTLAVYVLLPELRGPPHAKALCCHCAALLAASVMLAAGQFQPQQTKTYCISSALIIQFFVLAAFFWLNVLCIDISWAFSGLRGLLGSLMDTSRRKFLYYSLYAWGCPLVISIITAVLQEMWETNKLRSWVIAPQIGREFCWFYGVPATWAYLYGPMLLLLLANAALFSFTAVRLYLAHRDGAELNRGDSIRHDRSSRLSIEKRRMILYAKLFLLMGVTYIMEVVSWAVLPSVSGSGAHPFWYITDAINMLRSVFIFIIFCCKRTVARLLRKRMDAWGLSRCACACGDNAVDVERSPTHRSGMSTRQSSLLPLGVIPDAKDLKDANGSAKSASNADSRKCSLVTDAGSRKSSLATEAGSRKSSLAMDAGSRKVSLVVLPS